MEPGDLTQLLRSWSGGDDEALASLVTIVYEELRRMAAHYMSQGCPGHTLQTTALVHEAYARLLDTPHVRWRDRTHFFAVCARLMRRVLVDHSRSRSRRKRRSGHVLLTPLDEALTISSKRSRDLVAIDDALNALAAFDPRKSQVVELRFFGGLTVEETAEVLKISSDTVLRDWTLAKAWLARELGAGKENESRTVAAR